MLRSLNKHRIAVTEEPVPSLNGRLISRHHPFATGEGTDQHQQRGLGQVEVGHQTIHQPEPVTRVDKDVGFPLPRLQASRLAGRFLIE